MCTLINYQDEGKIFSYNIKFFCGYQRCIIFIGLNTAQYKPYALRGWIYEYDSIPASHVNIGLQGHKDIFTKFACVNAESGDDIEPYIKIFDVSNMSKKNMTHFQMRDYKPALEQPSQLVVSKKQLNNMQVIIKVTFSWSDRSGIDPMSKHVQFPSKK